jgi:hypothetical protein
MRSATSVIQVCGAVGSSTEHCGAAGGSAYGESVQAAAPALERCSIKPTISPMILLMSKSLGV